MRCEDCEDCENREKIARESLVLKDIARERARTQLHDTIVLFATISKHVKNVESREAGR